jgi:glutamyl-tRNA synthetase
VYAHVPFVAEPGSKNKLSKRKLAQYLKHADFRAIHEEALGIVEALGQSTSLETFNPVIVDFYERVGYLPEGLLNYLLLLGWSLDDKTEHFTRAQMISAFDLDRVISSPASLDVKKLVAMQAHGMQQVPHEQKVELCWPFLVGAGLQADRAKASEVVRAAGHRLVIAGDILDYQSFFVPDEAMSYDEPAFDKRIRQPDGARALLQDFREVLAASYAPGGLEGLVQAFLQARGLKMGDLVHGLRVALTGRSVGFGLYDTMAILGKERCLARLDRAIGRL